MSTIKRVALAFALIIMAGALFAASAQTRRAVQSKGQLAAALGGTNIEMPFDGLQVSNGTEVQTFSGNTDYFGWVCTGKTRGALPGNLTLSMNYGPANWQPGAEVTIHGGSWTMPVYMVMSRGGIQYVGTLYGEVKEGWLSWENSGFATLEWEGYINANLVITGGTQQLKGITGTGFFSAEMPENQTQPEMEGSVVFYF